MCTCTIIGRDATVDGSVLLGANNDWDGTPGQVVHVPRISHTSEEVFRTIRGYEIPQVPVTFSYSYTCCLYAIGHRQHAWAEGINENQVAIAQTGVHAFQPIASAGARLEADDIPWLVLERAASARHAIQMLGTLIREHGFNVSSWEGAEGVAVFGIADPQEGWWLELAPGNHWIAQRVPDHMASVRVNCFGTHDADLTDTDNVMCSEGLAEYAAARGWGGDKHHFDFSRIYGRDASINEWGPELDKINMRRRWRALCLYADKELPEEDLLYQVHPNRKLTREDVKNVLRDVYTGTRYDLAAVPAAGPGGNPFHDAPDSYSLAQRGTVASIVVQLRSWLPNAFGGVMWTALSNPRISLYIPIFAGIKELPDCFSSKITSSGREKPAWWAFKELELLTVRRYTSLFVLVETAQAIYEKESAALLRGITSALELLWAQDPDTGRYLIDCFCEERAKKAFFTAACLFSTLELQY